MLNYSRPFLVEVRRKKTFEQYFFSKSKQSYFVKIDFLNQLEKVL